MEDTNGKTVNETITAEGSASSSEVVRIDFGHLKKDLGGFVRGTVEEAINGLLDAEADQICNAKRYERSDERSAHRNGHYERKLHTGAGEVKLKVPKLRGASFETQIIERYRRRESSVEESLVVPTTEGRTLERSEDNVPGWRIGTTHRGHNRSSLGSEG